MATLDRYPKPLAATQWQHEQHFATTFAWEYDDGRDKLLNLYRKGKKLQWDAADRIDWSQDLDPENPSGLPDEVIPIFGSDVWRGMTAGEKAKVRTHFQAWQLSQFLHGEQGALVCTTSRSTRVKPCRASETGWDRHRNPGLQPGPVAVLGPTDSTEEARA